MLSQGLSPLARGKPLEGFEHAGVEGPIPAGAGETYQAVYYPLLTWAYPRWRGGND